MQIGEEDQQDAAITEGKPGIEWEKKSDTRSGNVTEYTNINRQETQKSMSRKHMFCGGHVFI